MSLLTKTIAFKVTEEDFARGKKLQRFFDLAEELRKAYKKILDNAGV